MPVSNNPHSARPFSRPVVGLCVSTMHGRIMENRVLVSQLTELSIPVVVVNQHEAGRGMPNHLGMDAPHVQVVNTESRGLSRSRNLALRELNASWAVLCDDDVSLDLEGLSKLEVHLSERSAAAPLPIVVCQLWRDAKHAWRAYIPNPWRLEGWTAQHVLRLQKVNSMELVVPTFQDQSMPLQFHEALGLGSASGVVAGEEGLLLANHLRQGGEITYLPLRLRFHPEESTGAHLNSQTAMAMGVVHRASFPAWSHPFLLIRMITKVLLRSPEGGRAAWAYGVGFFQSKSILTLHHG